MMTPSRTPLFDWAQERAEGYAGPWSLRAYGVLLQFVEIADKSFLTEEFLTWARERIDSPLDDRAWGPVILKAARAGLIRRVGFDFAKTSNLGPKTKWERSK